tara:strand:- start:357 stop:740 length:384 start_codon:yes stop_codon:yes gene_type:complete
MSRKENNSNRFGKIDYEDILEEEIINSYEKKLETDYEINKKNKRYYRLKRTPLEIVNRIFFFFFIGSFIFSFFLAYSENKIWFFLYILSSFSCIFYTPNRKALKELIAAWPNIEDLIKGRSLWKRDK